MNFQILSCVCLLFFASCILFSPYPHHHSLLPTAFYLLPSISPVTPSFLYIFPYLMELRILTPSPTLRPPMKRFFALTIAALTIAGCSKSASVSYQLTMNVTDPAAVSQLTQETFNVMQRRLERIQETITHMETTKGESGSIIMTLQSANKEGLEFVGEEMKAPFTFEIMEQAAPGQKADITVEGHGGFVRTNITGADLSWIEADKEPGKDLGRVHLVFTEEGRSKIAALFKRMKGKNIGIFVRKQLVSKLLVEDDVLREDIVIQDIPSVELAQAFAEDVNVGIHVTVTPLP